MRAGLLRPGGRGAKGTGIEDALGKCDKAWNVVKDEKDNKKKLELAAAFSKAIQEFDSKGASYEKVLLAAIDKADVVKVKPELDVLVKQIHALSATMKAHAHAAKTSAEDSAALAFTAKTTLTAVVGGVARARLFAAQVNAGKSPKVFNDGIAKAARDLTQYLGNVEKLRQKGYQFPHGDPTKFFKVMTPWAQGNRMLEYNAPADLLRRETAAFLQAVESVARWASS